MTLALLLGILSGESARGQIRVVVNPNGPGNENRRGMSPQAEPFHDAEIENYLSNAREGVAEKNWKYAIDSLQRIINDPGDSLLSEDDQVYQSGRRYAHRRLASLPAEAVAVYRLIHDGQAKRLLESAQLNHDERPLIELMNRFKLTSFGDDGIDLWTSWMLDAGRAAEVVTLLTSFLDLYPDGDVPKSVFDSKLAVAYGMMNQPEAAMAALGRIGEDAKDSRDRIAAFVALEEKAVEPRRSDASPWPRLMGGPGQNGRMPPVEPKFITNLFQEHQFDKSRAKRVSWNMLWDHKGPDPLPPPFYAITDGAQVLVKGRGGIFAYDPQTFEPLWKIDPPPLSTMEQDYAARWSQQRFLQRGAIRQHVQNPAEVETEVLVRDEVAAGIGVAQGVGFHIERLGADGLVGPEAGQGVIFLQGNVRIGANKTAGQNRLVAFNLDARDAGDKDRVLWRLGSNEPTTNFLDAVAFQSIPIEAGRNVLVIYRDQTSLMAAVLNPRDGSLVQKIGLCQLVPGETDLYRVIRPTLADSTAYFSSEQGLLFAVDLLDYTIRWASRYPRASELTMPQHARQSRSRMPMLMPPVPSSSPLVVGSLVIATPVDSTEVVAFDQATGQLRWSTRREPDHYLVAVDGEQVWLAGGRTVVSLHLTTGQRRWSEMVGRMTGRVAMSEDRLYVPLAGGLVALRGRDGHRLHEFELPGEQEPLGNLLCWDGAMYSTDSDGIRKLPDIERSYRKALAEYKAKPADPDIGLRLAWLELAQKKPKQAIDVLTKVKLAASDHERRKGFKAHLTVEAHTQLASGERDADKAIASLQAAESAAVSRQDQLTTRLSLAHRLGEADRLAEAGEQLMGLITSEVGDVVVRSEEGLTKSVRSWIGDRLSTLMEKLESAERKSLLEKVENIYEGAKTSKDVEMVRRVAQGSRGEVLTQSAQLTLADWSMENDQIAQSEQYLRSAASLDGDRNLTAQALSGLARIYLSPAVQAYDEAADVLRRMKAEYPAQRVFLDGREMPGSAFVEHQMRLLPPEWPSAPPSSSRTALVGNIREAWRLFSPEQGMAMFVSASPIEKSDRVPVFVGERTVRLTDTRTGEIVWSTDLEHSHSNGWPNLSERAVSNTGIIRPSPSILFGETDGQTLAVYTNDGLFGIEMCSGRRIWTRSLGTPSAAFGGEVAGPLSVKNGTIATLTDVNVVSVFNAADGTTRWERTVPGRTLTEVVATGPYVVALDEKWEQVIVFDATAGKLVSFLSFSQPKQSSVKLGLLVYEDRIVGPSDDAVVCFEMSSGNLLWREVFKRAITGIFKAAEDRVGVGMVFGHVSLLDVDNGRPAFETRVKPAVKGIATGIVENDRLLVTGDREIGGISETCLASVSMSSGEPVWEVVGLTQTTIPQAHLSAASNVIPVVSLRGDPRVRASGGGRPLAKVALFDKMTGRESASYDLTSSAAPDDLLVRKLQVHPGIIMISTDRTVRALSVNAEPVDGGVN